MKIGKKHISKKWLFVLVPVVIVLCGTAGAFAAGALTFTDIAGNTHEQSIVDMAERGVTTGYPDGTFRPDQAVTRAQMMTYLDRYTSGMGCTDCHDSTDNMNGKQLMWDESGHGTGESYVRGASSGCAGCHSGGGFSDMIAAGQSPNEVTSGDSEPTRQDCGACHQIHETYTGADWALETTAAVALYASTGNTYDGGDGNLCANCHQPRRGFEGYIDGSNAEVDSTHWGPHHGPQAAVLLGQGGYGATGSAAAHYTMVADTCVSCHVGNDQHSFEPALAACTGCHAGAEDFDIGDQQTEVQAMLDDLQDDLEAAGLLDEEGEPVVGTYPVDQAAALWNWILVAHEDSSLGVHNPAYTKALLQAGLDAFE